MNQGSNTSVIELDVDVRPVPRVPQPEGIVPKPEDRRFGQWLTNQPLSRWRSIRRVMTISLLMPLLAIVAVRATRLPVTGALGIYGMLVIIATSAIFYLAFVRYRDPSLDAPVVLSEDRPLVSVFIPVKNEEEQIASCVASVLQTTYPNIELFVINDGSTDETDAILRQIAQQDSRLHVIRFRTSHGKKKALVHAARRAQGKYFVYTDSDCWMATDAISKCIDVMEANDDIGAVSGHARALNPDASWLTKMQDVWYDGQFAIAKAAESAFGSVTCVSGPLAVFRREAVLNYLPAWAFDQFCGKPFPFATDRQLTAYVLGQRWVGEKLKNQYQHDDLVSKEPYEPREWKIAYVRAARVWTSVPTTFKSYIRQAVRWKKSFLRNFAFNWRWMWRRGVGPAALYYGHALWVVLAPMMAAYHLLWAPLSGAFLLCGLYLIGITMKGLVWAGAYRVQNPGDPRWRYRPFISVLSSVCLSWLIVYSALTIRKPVWSRGG